MSTILVVANETLAGAELLDVVKERAAAGGEGTRVIVCVPRNKPKHGNIIYDDFVFDAAKVRIDLARRFLRDQGISAIGDIGDPDPYTATMDAVAEHHPDEIIVSTYPSTIIGWLRRDLIERIEQASGPAGPARRRRTSTPRASRSRSRWSSPPRRRRATSC